MSEQIKYILGGDSITVYLDKKPYTVNRTAPTFGIVLKAVKDGDLAALRDALDVRTHIAKALDVKGAGKVKIDGSRILYEDREVSGLIASRIFEVLRVGLDVQPMVNFLENLMSNPSKRAVDELFGFLEKCRLPITPDGHFLAYKRVKDNYKDVHSGTFDNSVGQKLSMPRNSVDEDKNRTCSNGLHFCSYDYLAQFSGERIMVLKINPADVVAIPADYNDTKGRTCAYEVVDELSLDEYRKLPLKPITEDFTPDYGSASPVDEVEPEDEWESSEYEETVQDQLDWLDADEVDEILERVAEGKETLESIADDYGIMTDTVVSLMGTHGVKYGEDKVPVAVAASADDGALTAKDVKAIRKLLDKGESLASIGRQFKRHPRTIGRIRDYEAYSNV